MDYKFKGAFDSTAVYALGDVVNYGGKTWYLAKPTGAAGVIPGEYWNHWLPVDQDAGDVYRAIADYGFMPDVSSPQGGDTLVYDSTAGKWKNAPDFIPAISTPQGGDVIKYDSTAGKWKNASDFSPTITSPSNGDVIKYDSSTSKWVNGAAGGGVTVVHFTMNVGGTKTLDMKAGALYTACQQAPVFISGYDTDVQAYRCELIDYCLYDEYDGYLFGVGYKAATADDYPATENAPT